jgi:histidinol-phosphate aminotransferase
MKNLQHLILPHVRKLRPYEGVRPVDVMQRFGWPAKKVIRLNGNENPYGPSPRVAEALGNYRNYNRYPDPEQRSLRDALADYLSVSSDCIVVGNGSDEVIEMLVRMFLSPGENIVVAAPTFGMYAFAAEVCGGTAIEVPRDANFEIDMQLIKAAVSPTTKGIFIASPNNPTGNIASETQIRELLETDILVVVDETYYEFCGHTVLPLLSEYPNLVVLRTFSKWAGLAGLRIGLGVMHTEIAKMMMRMKSPYNVNLAAEVALFASLKDRTCLFDRVKAIVAERERMMGLLKNIPRVKPWPSQANFILCQLPSGRAKGIIEGLCRRGIFLRYFGDGRLGDFVRSSVGLPSETDAMVEALDDLVRN